ncbi:hypothetical protein SK128_022670, partial [Halocaridina rubra]
MSTLRGQSDLFAGTTDVVNAEIEPLAKVQDWVKGSKTKVNIPQLNANYGHNKSMIGVDHHDDRV